MSLVFTNFILTVTGILDSILTFYFFVVLVACILSFVNPDPYNVVVRVIRNLTEPIFYRIRKWFPFVVVGGLDLSPIVLVIIIQLIQGVVIQSIRMAMI